MAIETLSGVPTEFVAGDSLQWQETLSDYDQSLGWEVWTTFRLTDGKLHGFEASGSSTTWTTTINAPQTSGWTPGSAEYFKIAKKGQDQKQFAKGSVLIRPDPEQEDELAAAERMLASVEATIEKRLKDDRPERSTVTNTTHDKVILTDLFRIRRALRVEVRNIKARRRKLATGKPSRRVIQTVFTQ